MPSIATWIRQCDEHWFTVIFSHCRDLTVHNARLRPVDPGQMDALLLTGGGDISPDFLRQPIARPSLIVDTDCARDEWEFRAVGEMLESGKPILAICRGLQVLNVAMGGTLHIDIPDHDNAETANIQPLRHSAQAIHRFAAVNSSHHQALEKPAEGIEVEAWSASDGIVEQARLRSHGFAIGVQYHPERHALYLPLFADFFDRVRNTG
ncbi:MAG: gamma-glutamyl-gamma-aminobutyrate hydrolase family protein [Candidatus Binataceae bacterium]